MTEVSFIESRLPGDLGESMYRLVERLYPLNRSITGDGLRKSLAIIGEYTELSWTELSSGTRVFDWEIPDEWNIQDGYIMDSSGVRHADFKKSNLHVVGYSMPINERMSLEKLLPHLHTLPEKPDWIPYRTSYYNRDWGFCLSHSELQALKEGEYEVVIDSELKPGALTYAESILTGECTDEVLIFAHVCHPSLCNDNLSGVALAAHLARELGKRKHRLSYRFLFAPATIGSIAWLAQNEDSLSNITAGLVISVVGDSGGLVYKRSRRGDALIDRAAEHVIRHDIGQGDVRDFSPWGYDERQFCSPALNLPVGRITRTPNGEYPEYHTSADDLSIVRPEWLHRSFEAIWSIVSILETDRTYLNRLGKGEPQLGKRGLYRKIGGYQDIENRQLAMLWVLNQSDGSNSLLDIAEKAGLPFRLVDAAARDLVEADILRLEP